MIDFKAQAADWLKREFDRLTDRARLLESVDAGLDDEKAGRLVSHDKVVAEMKRRSASRKPAR